MKKSWIVAACALAALLLFTGCKGKTNQAIDQCEFVCTLSVECGNLPGHMEELDSEKRVLVPDDGVILPETEIRFSEGETAFDVLLKAAMHEKLHLEYAESPVYHSIYIEGINNLYEFDAGPFSGWMYSVNGEFPNFGPSAYKLKDGDAVRFLFTCDFGDDLGNRYTE